MDPCQNQRQTSLMSQTRNIAKRVGGIRYSTQSSCHLHFAISVPFIPYLQERQDGIEWAMVVPPFSGTLFWAARPTQVSQALGHGRASTV